MIKNSIEANNDDDDNYDNDNSENVTGTKSNINSWCTVKSLI